LTTGEDLPLEQTITARKDSVGMFKWRQEAFLEQTYCSSRS